jgi:KRAB domain-containing zinc finger protein
LDTKIKKIPIGGDPFTYWSGENAIKWPLLCKLAHKYFSAPATSAESERLFSTAGQILTNLRKKLLVENVEKLLFLHHNLTIYNFDY